jgi:hypothetical protein
MTGFAGTVVQGGRRPKQHPDKEKIHSCTLNFHDKTGGKFYLYFVPRFFSNFQHTHFTIKIKHQNILRFLFLPILLE